MNRFVRGRIFTNRVAMIFERYVGILSLSRDKLKSLFIEGGERVINEHATYKRSCCERILKVFCRYVWRWTDVRCWEGIYRARVRRL